MARKQPKPSPDDILTSPTAAEIAGLERTKPVHLASRSACMAS